ncbi:hypothetical protein CH274_16125 [Rhodococcus sp. 06-418-5]|uniref:hypothetical protein n=1 Tax=Rhodococcus sp. 06-418-5 TaxID=2022507 RepID=UPI000B9AB8C2|nr:hypothetical protein [Rhodococcus sp. 06-418-5]OZC78981.1 hypothetical protein CH274_16125 [Rhodococcus sp. 06-418-5]
MIAPLSFFVALVVLVWTGWSVACALLSGRSAQTSTARTTVRRVRFQHRMRSRGYLEVHEKTGRAWYPVYFHTGLLAIVPDAAATVSRSIFGRRAFVVEPGILAVPSGRHRTSLPPGTPLDAPRLNDVDLQTRSERFGSLRRRIMLDAPAAVAGPFIGLLWLVVDGGGLAEFVAVTVLAAVTALWWSAIGGSDPS